MAVTTITGTDATGTVWLPLTDTPTATAASRCQRYTFTVDNEGLFAYDVFSDVHLPTPSSSCLPAVVSSWWSQDTTSALVTSLGPFQCPYYDGTAAIGGSSGTNVTKVYCCPSGYTFAYALPERDVGFTAKQCASRLSVSQVVTYYDKSKNVYISPARAEETVWALPINGYNFASPTGLPTTTTETAAATRSLSAAREDAFSSVSSTISSTLASDNNNNINNNNSTSSDNMMAKGVGIGIGVAAALIILATATCLVVRRRRRRQQPHQHDRGGVASLEPPYSNLRQPNKTLFTDLGVSYDASQYSLHGQQCPVPPHDPAELSAQRETQELSSEALTMHDKGPWRKSGRTLHELV